MAVTERGGLLEERQFRGVGREHGLVGGAVAPGVDEADLFDAGGEHLVEQGASAGFLGAVAVGEILERQAPLGRAGGRDAGLS